MFLSFHTLKTLNNIKKIQPKILVATSNGNPCTTVISCYSYTNASDETGLITFYNGYVLLFELFPH